MVTAAELMAMHDHSHGAWGLLFPFVWFFLIFGAIYFLKRRGGWGGHRLDSGESVLAERFARGEITEQEFRERKEVLRGRKA
ncbi:MAG: SHOCT domain-containing protein [Actinomycetota bacterium]|nr:SHOCT domain-containing protein [Actinomycetota bacterium]